MLDEKDLQSIQTMIDASIRAPEKRMIAYFDTDVMPKFDLLAEGLQGVQAKLTPMTRIEAIEDDVALLKQVIRSMSKELAELKKRNKTPPPGRERSKGRTWNGRSNPVPEKHDRKTGRSVHRE